MDVIINTDGDCLSCQIRRLPCDRRRPICSNCGSPEWGDMCASEGEKEIAQTMFKLLPNSFNMNGRLAPNTGSHRDADDMFVGSGDSGEVWRSTMDEGITVAIKMPYRKRPSMRRLALWIREALIWKDLDHPNILTLLGVSTQASIDVLCFVTPYMANGNVMEYLRRRPEAKRLCLLQGMVGGLSYLHQHNPPVVHGNLKGSNVLISHAEGALLADFALSTFCEEVNSTEDTSKATVANARWEAPERISPDQYNTTYEASRTPSSDVFAVCRTFLEVLTGQVPFYELRNNFVIPFTVMKGLLPERSGMEAIAHGLSDEVWEIMCSGWNSDPSQRPSASQIQEALDMILSSHSQAPHGKSMSEEKADVLASPVSSATLEDSCDIDINENRNV